MGRAGLIPRSKDIPQTYSELFSVTREADGGTGARLPALDHGVISSEVATVARVSNL